MGGVDRESRALATKREFKSHTSFWLSRAAAHPRPGSQVVIAPVAHLRQGFEIQPVYISAGRGSRFTEAAVMAVIVCKAGVKVCSNSLNPLCTHLLHITLAWTDHIRRAQSLRDTLALSSSHTGVSPAAHQSLLTCFCWERTLQFMRQPVLHTVSFTSSLPCSLPFRFLARDFPMCGVRSFINSKNSLNRGPSCSLQEASQKPQPLPPKSEQFLKTEQLFSAAQM